MHICQKNNSGCIEARISAYTNYFINTSLTRSYPLKNIFQDILSLFFTYKSYPFRLQKLCFQLLKAMVLHGKSIAFATQNHSFYFFIVQ